MKNSKELGADKKYLPLQVFHCVHFECPYIEYEENWKDKSQTADPNKTETNLTDQIQQTETATEAQESSLELSETVN